MRDPFRVLLALCLLETALLVAAGVLVADRLAPSPPSDPLEAWFQAQVQTPKRPGVTPP